MISQPNLTRGLVAEKAPAGATGAGSYVSNLIAAQPQFLAYSVKNLPSFWPWVARHVFRMPLLTWTVTGLKVTGSVPDNGPTR